MKTRWSKFYKMLPLLALDQARVIGERRLNQVLKAIANRGMGDWVLVSDNSKQGLSKEQGLY